MYTNADCTLYLQQDGNRYNRLPIEGVFWDPKGSEGADAVVFIPIESVELPMWKPDERNYIAQGILSDEIYDTRTLHAMLQTRRLLTIKHIVRRDYGSTGMRHWEVHAV